MDTDDFKWLFLDINSYFASIEQNENLSLIGKPVAVVPVMTESTCAIAASYEAKAYGIKTGTKIYEALEKCPDLICILARHDLYVEYHHKIIEAVDKHLPINKVWSIDEMDCELIGKQRNIDAAIKIAKNIKKQIYHDVGPAIRCSIGIAPNSFLAKLATDMQKPDGLVTLAASSLPGAISHLRLTDLPGINTRMEERLRKARVKTILDFWDTSPKQARAIWNNVNGERFWYWLHGKEAPVPATNISMIGHSRILDPDMRTPEKARLMARRLLFKAVLRLRRKKRFATKLSLGIRLINGNRIGKDIFLPAANDPFAFLSAFDSMWEETITQHFTPAEQASLQHRRILKKVSVVLHGLEEASLITEDLFACDNRQKAKQQKTESLSNALEKLQEKYKREVVWLGDLPQTKSGHVGTKIAFSRVPDKEEFWE